MPIDDATRVRIVSANLSGRGQSYREGDAGSRILRALKPDIVLLQEANIDGRDGDPRRFDEWVRDTFGPAYRGVRSVGDEIPNAVITHLPIRAAFEMPDAVANNRDHKAAVIDVPGLGAMVAVSVHLLTRDAPTRASQARALRDAVQTSLNAMPGAFAVIGGDFNTSARHEPAFDALRDVVDADAPYPRDEHGNDGTNARRTKPYDGIYVSRALESREVPVVLGGRAFPAGVVIDTRSLSPDVLAALPDVRREDSGAHGMQHMAVVRDFGRTPTSSAPSADVGDLGDHGLAAGEDP